MSNSQFVPLAYTIATGAVNSIATGRFDAYNYLLVHVRIAGYGGAAIAQLQFNDDAGTTAYAYRVSSDFAAPATGVAGAAAGVKVANVSSVNARALITFNIGNVNGRAHGIHYTGSDQSEAAATAPNIIVGAGLWATTSQITKITLEGGGQTLLTGTDLAVYGLQGLG